MEYKLVCKENIDVVYWIMGLIILSFLAAPIEAEWINVSTRTMLWTNLKEAFVFAFGIFIGFKVGKR